MEYALFLAIVAAAFLGMQIYLKRGIQGRVRDLADQIAGGGGPAHQYESATSVSQMTTRVDGHSTSSYNNGTVVSTVSETTNKTGNEISRPDTL
jgi:hypothetical protein